MKTIQDSIMAVEKGPYKYHIHKDTLQIFNEERCLWGAVVTTTHNHEYGEKELTFSILVRWDTIFSLNEIDPRDLSTWLLTKGK